MGLLGTQTAYQYYTSNLKFIATAGQTTFTVNGEEAFDPAITSANQVYVFVNGTELDPNEYSYASNVITLIGITLVDDDEVVISLKESRLGTYRYIGLDDIVNNFIVSYVGDNKLVQKAEELVANQSLKVRAKFIRKVTKEKIELNTALIEKRRLLLGIKGYCTDLSEQQLSNELVISRYHQLWHVEQSFRMSKFDLQEGLSIIINTMQSRLMY